jgi:hypothetical protein
MKIHNVDQGSPEWHALRCGVPTASEFSKILTPKEMKLSSQSPAYMYRLLGEWMTGHAQEMIETEYMQIGKELEERAVKAYCFQSECQVEQIGFVTTDCGRFGCSPDRFVVGAPRGVEIKTHPQAIGVHVQAMVERAMSDAHKSQVQGCLWICEKEYWDLVSYTEELPTVIVRVGRDEKYIKALSAALGSFSEIMEKLRLKLTQEYGPFERKPAPHPDDAYDGMGVSDADLDALIQHGAISPQS